MGYVEGRNVAIVFQWTGGNYGLLPTLADEFVRQRVSVLVAGGTAQAARAGKAATATIPIVFFVGSDPVASNLVTSFNRPGGNLTGVVSLNVDLLSKRIEVLHEAVPTAISLAVLINPGDPFGSEIETKTANDAARMRGLNLHFLHVTNEREIDAAFLKLVQLRASG